MAIKIIEGIDLIYDVKKYDIVLVGTSIMNKLGNGFQYKVGLNFPSVYSSVKTATKYGDPSKLGQVTVVEGEPTFAICYITKGRYNPSKNPDTVEYEALKNCLKLISAHFKGKTIASTILGYSDFEGGGNKDKILSIFKETMKDMDVTLYDYKQKNINDEKKESWANVVNNIGGENYDEYKKKYFWQWGIGIYEPMPEGKSLKEIKNIINEKNIFKKNLGSFQK